MKTVKVNYARVDDYFDKKQNLIYDILKNHGYDVQISDEPDYIICDALGAENYEYCKYPQVRIMCSGENYIPDFNLIDYSIARIRSGLETGISSFRPAYGREIDG